MKQVCVLGNGQLGRMLRQAGEPLGIAVWVQMPSGIPVGPLAIGKAGAANAALLSAQIRATHDKELNQRLNDWRKANTDEVMENPDPRGAA